ncbi:nucleotidyltransferase family protein [Chitinophaga sp. YIM B06452]|uniref:nucleotidyltransferase family protein n=1 Tax=Chitinophaga sp. YIM B06452 TaxID=3082158 RepID=UPI0031FF24ED
MYTTNQILNILRAKKPQLQQKYHISELGIFGSYARGDFNEKSDIDILVDFSIRIDGFDYIRLAHELEDTFRHKIDMVSRKGIKPQYLPYVEKSLIHV